MDEAALQKALSRLVAAELIYQRGLLPQARYIFKHALVQDVYLEDLKKEVAAGFRKDERVRFSGKIRSVNYVFGVCSITLGEVTVDPA